MAEQAARDPHWWLRASEKFYLEESWPELTEAQRAANQRALAALSKGDGSGQQAWALIPPAPRQETPVRRGGRRG